MFSKRGAKPVFITVLVVGLFFTIFEYQNCIGQMPGSGTSSSTGLALSSGVTVSPSQVATGGAFTASAPFADGTGGNTVTCSWVLTNSSNAVVATYPTQSISSQSGQCSTSGSAPSTAGTYTITVTVTDSSTSTSTQGSAAFTVGSSCLPSGSFCGAQTYGSSNSCSSTPSIPNSLASCSTTCCSGGSFIQNCGPVTSNCAGFVSCSYGCQ